MLPTFVVPYVIEEPKRERIFTPEMEKAAILCLLEVKRRKPTILSGTSEEVEYIVKFHYPLWDVPWKDRCIIIDGLGFSSVTVTHNEIPNVIDFTEDLKKSSVSFKLFREALKKHNQTFKEFVSAKEEVMEAVIGEGSVLESVSRFIDQAESVREKSGCDAILVPPKISREESEDKTKRFIGEWQKLRTDVEALKYALEVLKEEIEHHKEKASMEIEQIWKGYEERISEMKKLADERIKRLSKEKEKETERTVKLHEKRVRRALEEERKLQPKVERLKRSLEEQQKRRKDQRRKYPKRSTTRIDRRIELYREKNRDLTENVRGCLRLMEEIRREQKEDLRRIEEKYLSMAAKEMEKLEILEQSRNLEISEKSEEIKEMEESSSVIEDQIKQLLERKNNDIKGLEDKALFSKVEETVLIGVPFYLVQYKTPQKTRRDVYPPVTATSYVGMVRKIQRALLSFSLEARIQLLLSSRFPELDKAIFENLKKSLEADVSLRESISDIGRSRNLLNLPEFKEEVTKGICELEVEGWLNAKEKENILNIYAR